VNRHFLEFWGRALLQAAQSQKQLEDLAKWCQRGVFSFQDYLELFKSSYGLSEVAPENPDGSALWQKAQENFQESFKEYLNIFGVVPREDYADLARQYEELQQKVAQQEATIKDLRQLLEGKGLGMEATSLEFQKLIQKQGDQFQKFLQSLGEAAKTEKSPPG
jgi:hypothetical protein